MILRKVTKRCPDVKDDTKLVKNNFATKKL